MRRPTPSHAAALPPHFFWRSWFHNTATPLTTLLSLCEEFSDKLSPSERERILAATHHLQQVFIHGQYQLTGLSFPKKTFSITQSMLTLAPMIEHLCSLQAVEFTLWCDRVAFIHGHQSVLEQILMILWNNALEAIEQNSPQEKKLLTRLSIDTATVQIFIANSGSRIDPQQREAIFEVGFTNKSSAHNAGLGLPFVRFHMENTFQGQCEIIDYPEFDCCFLLTFPRASLVEFAKKEK